MTKFWIHRIQVCMSVGYPCVLPYWNCPVCQKDWTAMERQHLCRWCQGWVYWCWTLRTSSWCGPYSKPNRPWQEATRRSSLLPGRGSRHSWRWTLNAAQIGVTLNRRRHCRSQLVKAHSLHHTKCMEHISHKLNTGQIHRISKMLLHNREDLVNFGQVLGISSLHRESG